VVTFTESLLHIIISLTRGPIRLQNGGWGKKEAGRKSRIILFCVCQKLDLGPEAVFTLPSKSFNALSSVCFDSKLYFLTSNATNKLQIDVNPHILSFNACCEAGFLEVVLGVAFLE
jgi:hypothetical protein